MTLPVVAIRPQPGCAATVEAGVAMGLPIEGWPLSAVAPLPWDAPSPATFHALLIGSANAFRHGGAALAGFADKPAYVVGRATADAARASGFAVAAIGSGGLQSVLDAVPAGQVLLRLAGEEHVPLVPPPGVQVVTRVVYASTTVPLPAVLAARLGHGAVVLLHSAAAARHLAAECDRLDVPRGAVRIAALGPRIAAAAGSGWGRVASASKPDDSALLALAADLCH